MFESHSNNRRLKTLRVGAVLSQLQATRAFSCLSYCYYYPNMSAEGVMASEAEVFKVINITSL